MLDDKQIDQLEIEIAVMRNYLRNMMVDKRANGIEHADESYLLKATDRLRKIMEVDNA